MVPEISQGANKLIRTPKLSNKKVGGVHVMLTRGNYLVLSVYNLPNESFGLLGLVIAQCFDGLARHPSPRIYCPLLHFTICPKKNHLLSKWSSSLQIKSLYFSL